MMQNISTGHFSYLFPKERESQRTLIFYVIKVKFSDYFGTSLMEFICSKVAGPKRATCVGVNT